MDDKTTIEDKEWEKFKDNFKEFNEKHKNTTVIVNSDWGLINFNFKDSEQVLHGNFNNIDEYLDAQKGNSREWFSLCYYFNYPAGYIGRIERFNKDKTKVLFKRIRVSGDYGDGTCFEGKEDHVWMDSRGFKKFKPDDCVSFKADVYAYLRQSDKTIDFGLESPSFIQQVEKYNVPTDEELNQQFIEQIVCETCLYNEQCYCGLCINPEYKEQRIKELMNLSSLCSDTAS